MVAGADLPGDVLKKWTLTHLAFTHRLPLASNIQGGQMANRAGQVMEKSGLKMPGQKRGAEDGMCAEKTRRLEAALGAVFSG